MAKNSNNLDELFLKLKRWYSQDIKKAKKFREYAKEDFAFYNGEQWSSEDKEFLRDHNRPVMTFNRIAPLINAVTGSERNNKREVRYIPRTLGAAIPNELLTNAAEWFRDQADAENEDSDAFTDTVICGMGWTDTRLSYEDDPSGTPVISRLDPLKMVWDCNSVKANLVDAQRLWYVDKKPLSVAKQLFPDVDQAKLNASWACADQVLAINHVNPLNYYNGVDKELNDVFEEDYVTLVECRYYDLETYYRVTFNNQTQDIDEKTFKQLREAGQPIDGVKLKRKVAKRVFIGSEILEAPDEPMAPRGQLGWECITAYENKSDGIFYGLVRAAKDPQRWSNKFFSQVMHILNSQSKGGILAELGAFEDIRQAEESFNKTEAITWVANGALGQGKIQPKPAPQLPTGFFQLFNESKESITQTTGLSAEFIGTREVNQAGVLEAQRRQSTLNLLAGIFDSLKKYRKRQGRIILYLIQNYLADGRLIRIVGQENGQYVPLLKNDITSAEYDIIVDDAPTSPNEKERTFSIIQSMLPMLQQFLTPDLALEMLRYSPLPATFVQKISELVQQSQQQQQQQQSSQDNTTPQEKVEQIKLAGIQADAQSKQALKQLDIEGKKYDVASKQIDNMMKQREIEAKMREDAYNQEVQLRKSAIDEVTNSIRQQRTDNLGIKNL